MTILASAEDRERSERAREEILNIFLRFGNKSSNKLPSLPATQSDPYPTHNIPYTRRGRDVFDTSVFQL
jgi:hypothetical protein